MPITNEEIIADIQKALVATIDELNTIGIKYTKISMQSDSVSEVHRADGVADVIAILVNILYGDEGSNKLIEDNLKDIVVSSNDTIH